MSMPKELLFIRHGQSEANIVQKHDDHGMDPEVAAAIMARPDWQQRLSPQGIEQAKQARVWLERNIGGLAAFDTLYVSPFVRTRETALYLGGDELEGWTTDDRLVERSWGVFGKHSRSKQRELFPLTFAEKAANPWFAALDGGESQPMVSLRFRDLQGTLHREQDDGRVAVVCHGDFMNNARYNIERMLPEEWQALDKNSEYDFRNCMMLHYSRINPEDSQDIREKIHWRRYINPIDLDDVPEDGRWIELSERRRFRGGDLRAQVEQFPALLPQSDKIADPNLAGSAE